MTARPFCVSLDTPISEAAEVMEREEIGAIPVLDGEQLTGIITDRDIVIRAIAKGKDPRGMPVRDVLTREVIAVNSSQSLSDAIEPMSSYQIRRLPVIDDDNRLVGVVAQADVALAGNEKTSGKMVEEISRQPEGPRQR
jgi:CBS domain-containing protein